MLDISKEYKALATPTYVIVSYDENGDLIWPEPPYHVPKAEFDIAVRSGYLIRDLTDKFHGWPTFAAEQKRSFGCDDEVSHAQHLSSV